MDDLQLNEQKNELSVPPAGSTPKGIPQKTRKILLAFIGVVTIAVFCIAVAVVSANKPINRFKSALKSGEYKVAEALYEQNNSDSKFSQSAKDTLKNLLTDMEAQFASGKISSEEAHIVLENMAYYGEIRDNYFEAKSRIKSLDFSKDAYKKAEANLENSKYLDAIKEYEAVIEGDTENYSSAQKKKESTIEALCSNAVQEANNSLAQGDAIAAYKVLYAVGDYKNSNVTELLSNVTAEAQNQIVDDAEKLLAKEDYRRAYLSFAEQPDELKNAKIKDLEANVFNSLVAQADAKAASGDYDGAIALLEKDDGTEINSDCKAKAEEITKKARTSKLAALKSKVKTNYDKIDKMYSILPAGITVRFNNSRSTLPVVSFRDNEAKFGMALGFIREDWIFMDEIIIDCDGKQFTLSVNYSNRDTTVGWGRIMEQTTFIDFPEAVGLDDMAVDFAPLIKAMRNAKTVTIRFRGDGGTKDVIVTNACIDQITTLWDISELLNEDPTLISVLQ